MKKGKKMKKMKKCVCKTVCKKCKCKKVKGKKTSTESLKLSKLNKPRKRGRPRKSIEIKEKIVKDKDIEKKTSTECKRGRGRPKKIREVKDEVALVPTYTYKALGFCPACKLSIADIDIIEGKDLTVFGKHIYACPRCDRKGNVAELKAELGIERPKTKKEYFQSINSTYTWHDYNPSSNINSVAKGEKGDDPLLADLEDEHMKTVEDDVISKKLIDNESHISHE